MAQKKDEGLNGNEKIEQAVCQLQQEPTQEQLAHTLTEIRQETREINHALKQELQEEHRELKESTEPRKK